MWLLNPYRFAAGYTPTDANAAAYLAAVEAADGQPLEPGVRLAIDQFVIGCKADGTWNAIKASCILAGARTLAGALIPLAGTAPTRFGTEGGWNYNRKTGLQGNGTDNYLDSNRNNNADPQDSKHVSVYATTRASEDAFRVYIGATFAATGSSSTQILTGVNAGKLNTRLNDNTTSTSTGNLHSANGLFGLSRSNSTNYLARGSGISEVITRVSMPPTSNNIFVFSRNLDGVAGLHSTARIAFYSIGESLDLALLDTRVTALRNALAAAIP